MAQPLVKYDVRWEQFAPHWCFWGFEFADMRELQSRLEDGVRESRAGEGWGGMSHKDPENGRKMPLISCTCSSFVELTVDG